MGIDWKKITSNKNITEVFRIVETFYVTPKRNENIKIKIEVQEHPGGIYYGIANYGFWSPGNPGSPYISINDEKNIEDAVNESIKGFCPFDIDNFPNDVIFYVPIDDNTGENIDYIDGNGNSVTKEEAKKKIKQWRVKNAPDIA